MFQVEGKVALITGGANGIGLAFCNELLKNGAKGIAIVDYDEKGYDKVDDLNKTCGDKVEFIKKDVTNGKELEDAFATAAGKFGQLDIVINNAGIIDEVNWPKMVNVNLNAVIEGTNLAMEKYLPLYKSGDIGVVVNTASSIGFSSCDALPVYTVTKQGVIALGRVLGSDYHFERTGVKVISLCPGLTETKKVQTNPTKTINHIDRLTKTMAKNKMQSPENVSKALIPIIQKGRSGSVWIVEKGISAYEVEFPDRHHMKKEEI